MRPHRFVAYIVLLAVLGMAALLPGRVLQVEAQDALAAQQDDAGWIAFAHPDPAQRGIWIVRPDGAELHQLTRGWDLYPAWSPDGSKVAYLHMEQVQGNAPLSGDFLNSGRSSVRVVDLQGQLLWTLSTSQWAQGEPSWSSGGLCWAPVWSPDGQALAYMHTPVSGLWSNITIFRMTPQPVMEQRLGRVLDLVWAPGRDLTWGNFSLDKNESVLMVGDQPRYTAKGLIVNPRPSLAGQAITFGTIKDVARMSGLTLEQMNIDGTNHQTLLTISPELAQPDKPIDFGLVAQWAPQGQRYLIGIPYNYTAMSIGIGFSFSWTALPLFVLDAEGKKQPVSVPQYGTMDLIGDQPWSPDSAQVTFLRSAVSLIPTSNPLPAPVGVFDPETVGIYAGPLGQTKRIVALPASLGANRLSMVAPVWQPHTTADTTPAPPAPSSAPRLAYIGEDGNAWVVRADGTDRRQLTSDGESVPTRSDSNLGYNSADYRGYTMGGWAPDGVLLALVKGQKSVSFSDTRGEYTWMVHCEYLVIIDTQIVQNIATIPITACPARSSVIGDVSGIEWEQNSNFFALRYEGSSGETSRVNVHTGAMESPRSMLPLITENEWQEELLEEAKPCDHWRYTNKSSGQRIELLSSCTVRSGDQPSVRDIDLAMPNLPYYQGDGTIDPNHRYVFDSIRLQAVRGAWVLWQGDLVGGISRDTLSLMVNLDTGKSFTTIPGVILHSFSPDNRYLFFTTTIGHFFIQVMDLANQFAVHELAAGDRESTRWAPASTPQGEIAYVHEKNLYLLDLATRATHQLTRDGKDSDPAWSPDGQWLAFARDGDIYKLRVNSTAAGELVRVTSDPHEEGTPAFSPEGTLFFARTITQPRGPGSDGRDEVVQVDANGEKVVYVYEDMISSVTDLSFASNTRFTFFTFDGIRDVDLKSNSQSLFLPDLKNKTDFFSVGAKNGYCSNRIFCPTCSLAPGIAPFISVGGTWSHAGTQLAFAGNADCADPGINGYREGIWLIEINGTAIENPHVLPLARYTYGLDWSPDDQWLVFDQWYPETNDTWPSQPSEDWSGAKRQMHSQDQAENDGLWVISAQGSEPQRITDVGSQPAWRPTGVTPTPTPTSAVTISGKVTDGHGHPLVGALVRVVDEKGFIALMTVADTPLAQTVCALLRNRDEVMHLVPFDGMLGQEICTTTDHQGVYTTTGVLSPGSYHVQVRLQDGDGHKRVLAGPSHQEVFVDAPLAVDAGKSSYLRDIDFGKPEELDTSLALQNNKGNLDDLAAIYFRTWQADYFITTKLQHPNYYAVGNVWAFSGPQFNEKREEINHTKYYAGQMAGIGGISGTLHLTDQDSVFGPQHAFMNIEWHESFHHLMWLVIPSAMDSVDYGTSHGGFNNAHTRDSWVEGWAEFWPCVMKSEMGGIENPLYDGVNISLEYNLGLTQLASPAVR